MSFSSLQVSPFWFFHPRLKSLDSVLLRKQPCEPLTELHLALSHTTSVANSRALAVHPIEHVHAFFGANGD